MDLAGAFQVGQYKLTARVRRHMRRKGWNRSYLVQCIVSLGPADFHKSQEHQSRAGLWLDTYRPSHDGVRKYIKFVLDDDGECFVVLSFCDDGEVH
jgi:hypothetical protein